MQQFQSNHPDTSVSSNGGAPINMFQYGWFTRPDVDFLDQECKTFYGSRWREIYPASALNGPIPTLLSSHWSNSYIHCIGIYYECPYAIKNLRRARNASLIAGFGCPELVLYGIVRVMVEQNYEPYRPMRAQKCRSSTNESRGWVYLPWERLGLRGSSLRRRRGTRFYHLQPPVWSDQCHGTSLQDTSHQPGGSYAETEISSLRVLLRPRGLGNISSPLRC